MAEDSLTPQPTETPAHGHDHDHDHDHGHDHDHDHENEERGEQTVTVEDIGPSRKKLTIEVPAERIAKKFDAGYKKLKTDAQVPGFRRGRAPLRLLEKRFGSSIRDEVKGQIVSECYSQAIEDQKLEVLGEPDIKDAENLKLPESGALKFEVEVEVLPTFELPPLEGIEVIKPIIEVNEKGIAEEISRLRERFGKMASAAADEAAKEDDYLLADVRILAGMDTDPQAGEEVQIAHHPGTYMHVAGKATEYKGHVAGIIVEDLGRKLAGKKAGEMVSISLTGPSGHENEKIKDKPITLAVRIDRIERLEPAAVESLPGHLGLESVEQLKERLQLVLEERREREQRSAMNEQICDYLMEKVEMTLPEQLSGRQAARQLQRQAMELAYRGVPEAQIEQQIAEAREGSEEAARQQLKLYFVLEQAAKKLDVKVSEAEINGAVAMLAAQQGRRPEKLRQEMLRGGRLDQLYLQVREQKTLTKILASAKITEGQPPEPKKKSRGKGKGKGKEKDEAKSE